MEFSPDQAYIDQGFDRLLGLPVQSTLNTLFDSATQVAAEHAGKDHGEGGRVFFNQQGYESEITVMNRYVKRARAEGETMWCYADLTLTTGTLKGNEQSKFSLWWKTDTLFPERMFFELRTDDLNGSVPTEDIANQLLFALTAPAKPSSNAA